MAQILSQLRGNLSNNAGVITARMISLCLGLILLTSIVISINVGSDSLSVHDILSVFFLHTDSQNQQANLAVMEFRLPRTLIAMLAGGLFALSGALLQGLTRNPLADPSLIGISQGAAAGVVILTVLFPDSVNDWREVVAFSSSLLIAFGIQWLSGQAQTLKFILLGIGVSTFMSAITSVLLTYGSIQSASSALTWLAGSTHLAQWSDVKILTFILVIVLSASLMLTRALDVLLLGHEAAIGLGLAINPVKLAVLSLCVVAAAFATAIVGPLGFVGLISAHVAKRLYHSTSYYHLINSTLVGGILVVMADVIGRSAFNSIQIAAGLVTALLGAPLFALLLIKRPSKGMN